MTGWCQRLPSFASAPFQSRRCSVKPSAQRRCADHCGVLRQRPMGGGVAQNSAERGRTQGAKEQLERPTTIARPTPSVSGGTQHFHEHSRVGQRNLGQRTGRWRSRGGPFVPRKILVCREGFADALAASRPPQKCRHRLAVRPRGTPQEISRGQARASGRSPGCHAKRAMPQRGIEEIFGGGRPGASPPPLVGSSRWGSQ